MEKNNKVVKEQTHHSSRYWKERFEEASDLVKEYIHENRRLVDENQQMADYIDWKGLADEWHVFRENAHEEYFPDEPFPRYVM